MGRRSVLNVNNLAKQWKWWRIRPQSESGPEPEPEPEPEPDSESESIRSMGRGSVDQLVYSVNKEGPKADRHRRRAPGLGPGRAMWAWAWSWAWSSHPSPCILPALQPISPCIRGALTRVITWESHRTHTGIASYFSGSASHFRSFLQGLRAGSAAHFHGNWWVSRQPITPNLRTTSMTLITGYFYVATTRIDAPCLALLTHQF